MRRPVARVKLRPIWMAALCVVLAACQRGGGTRAPAAAVSPSPLNASLLLRVTGIRVDRGSVGHLMPMDSPGNDRDTFAFAVTNRSAKPISAFEADVELTNDAGEVLYRGLLHEELLLQPSSTAELLTTVIDGSQTVPHPELVRGATPERTRLRYRIRSIGYADGTGDAGSAA